MSRTVQITRGRTQTTSSSNKSRPSFRTASLVQAQAAATEGGSARQVTITRPMSGGAAAAAASNSGPQRVVVNAVRTTSRVVKTAGADAIMAALAQRQTAAVDSSAAAASSARFVIQAAGAGQATRRTVAPKRRSGDIATLTRTITNSEQDTESTAEPKKRGRGVNGVAFAVELPPSSSNGPIQFALPTPVAMVGVSAPRSTLAENVARAAADRVAASQRRGQSSKADSAPNSAVFASGQPLAVAAAAPAAPITLSLPRAAPASPATPPVTVLVRNLASGVNPRFLLTALFGPFDVASLTVDTDPTTHACNGTAEVVFASEKEALEAISLCQGQQLLGQPVRLSIIAQKDTNESAQQQDDRQRQAQLHHQHQQQQQLQPLAPTPLPHSTPLYPSASSYFGSSVGGSEIPASSFHHPSPFAAPPANVGFVWDGAGDSAMDDVGEETIFNITNLKLPIEQTAGGEIAFAVLPQPKKVVLRPKSVVVSGGISHATAGAAASPVTPAGKPIITLSKNR